MDPLSELKGSVAEAISTALQKEGIPVDPGSIDIVDRTQKGFGDISTPVILKVAASKGLDPMETAIGVVSSLGRLEMIERVEPTNGYLNFFVDWNQFTKRLLREILESGRDFGKSGKPRGTLILEHTSVNPTGPLNIARSRNSIIGDSLARIYGYMGWKISRQYLLNDMGHQIVVIYWGFKNGVLSKKLRDLYPKYAGKKDFQTLFTYVPAVAKVRGSPEAREEVARLESQTHSDPGLLKALRSQSMDCLDGQLETLSRLGIEFDEVMPESQFLEEIQSILDRLRSKGVLVENEDGSVGLDLSSLGLARRRTKYMTLLKSDGSSTYTLRDIAYHEWKFKKGDSFITVLGEDHKREFIELKAILEMLGHDKDLHAAFYSFVTYEGGKKMSTRMGQTVPLDVIIDDAITRAKAEVVKRRGDLPVEKMNSIANQVGLGAIKFNILKVDPSKSIRFNWDEAINFAGDSSAYVQYAGARASSILKKAGQFEPKDLDALSSREERELIWAMARTPGVVEKSADDMKPNYVAEHAIEVATLFNRFYMQHRVLQVEEPLRSARLTLVACIRTILWLTLDLLGVAAPEEI